MSELRIRTLDPTSSTQRAITDALVDEDLAEQRAHDAIAARDAAHQARATVPARSLEELFAAVGKRYRKTRWTLQCAGPGDFAARTLTGHHGFGSTPAAALEDLLTCPS